MPWSNQGGGGGPWGSGGGGGGQSPWGRGGGPGGPPDIEEMLRRGQDRFKNIFPGGFGGGRVIALVIGVAIAIWAFSGFYRVEPNQVGVELIFGRMIGKSLPGLNYNLPAPIGEVMTPNVTNVNRIEVGFRTTPGGRGESTVRNREEESLMLTGDENIIDIQLVVFWKVDTEARTRQVTYVEDGVTKVREENIDGIYNFLFNIRNPEQSVKDASEAAMREIIGKSAFEFARTDGRVQIATEAKSLIQRILDSYGAGVSVVDVQLQKIDPPGIVLDAFRDVQAAGADRERSINEATAYFNEVVQRAQGQAEQVTKQAEAYKEAKIARADGESQRFDNIFEEYQNQGFITRRRIYLETMRDVMREMDKVLIDNSTGGSGVVPYLPLNELRNQQRSTAASDGTGGPQQ